MIWQLVGCSVSIATNLEHWRKMIEERHVQLQRQAQYRLAIRFGLVQEIKKPIVFYFETLNASEGE